MKIGLWNRLAIVAGGLFALIGSSWQFIKQKSISAEMRENGYSNCLDISRIKGANIDDNYCREIWLNVPSPYNFEYWLAMVGTFAIIAVIIYGIVWMGVQLGKWVWRGRSA